MSYFTYGNGNQNAYKCLKEKLMDPNIFPISPPPSIYTLRIIHTHTHTYVYEKVEMLATQVCPILCDTMDCNPPGSSANGILQARILEWVAIPFSRGWSLPGMKPRSLAWQKNSLPSESPGKPKNTGVGSLSLLRGSLSSCHFLLQGIFPNQVSNLNLML